MEQFYFPALWAILVIMSANNARLLAPGVITAIALLALYPAFDLAQVPFVAFIGAVLLVNFRD